MKKIFTSILAMFLVLTFATFTMAEPGKEKAYGINKPKLKNTIDEPNINKNINATTSSATATAGSFLNNDLDIGVFNPVNVSTPVYNDLDIGVFNPVSNEQTVNTPVNNEINIEASDLSAGRDFAIPGHVNYPGLVPYFGESTDGHRFISVTTLLMYNDVWRVEDARNMLKGFKGKKDIQIRNMIHTKDVVKTDIVKFITKPANGSNLVPIAIGSVAAMNGKSISADVLAKIIVAASERGATHIQILAEGKNRNIVASGWGIGFNATHSQLHESDNSRGSVGSGGTGYSTGKSGYEDYPWIQFFLLK